MNIDKKNTYRIVVTYEDEPTLNMVYAELGDEDCEVFGAFSGICGGLGMFHQNADGDIVVSDDPFEFDTKFEEEVENICKKMESLRSDFENLDADGTLIGLSADGKKFIKDKSEELNGDGYMWSFDPDASDDFIYDIQDDWNLAFNI